MKEIPIFFAESTFECFMQYSGQHSMSEKVPLLIKFLVIIPSKTSIWGWTFFPGHPVYLTRLISYSLPMSIQK